MARPGGLELPTFWFVARRSIQLSYGRAARRRIITHNLEMHCRSRVPSRLHQNCATVPELWTFSKKKPRAKGKKRAGKNSGPFVVLRSNYFAAAAALAELRNSATLLCA